MHRLIFSYPLAPYPLLSKRATHDAFIVGPLPVREPPHDKQQEQTRQKQKHWSVQARVTFDVAPSPSSSQPLTPHALTVSLSSPVRDVFFFFLPGGLHSIPQMLVPISQDRRLHSKMSLTASLERPNNGHHSTIP